MCEILVSGSGESYKKAWGECGAIAADDRTIVLLVEGPQQQFSGVILATIYKPKIGASFWCVLAPWLGVYSR